MYRKIRYYSVFSSLFYFIKFPEYIFKYAVSKIFKKDFIFHEILINLNTIRIECNNINSIDNKKENTVRCYYKYNHNNIYIKIRVYDENARRKYDNIMENIKLHTNYPLSSINFKNGYCMFTIYLNFDPIYEYYGDNREVTIGTGQNGLITWKYAENPHLLVVGDTGQGKSIFVRYLLNGIYTTNIEVDCIDGKIIDYSNVKDKFSRYIANTKNKKEIINFVYDFKQRMNERYYQMKEDKISNYYEKEQKYKPNFLLIDELLIIIETMSKKELDEFKELLLEIILLGRAGGFFIIATAQRADTKYIDGAIRDNFKAKIVLGSASEESYKMMFNNLKIKPLKVGKAWIKFNDDIEMVSIPFYKQFEF